MKYVQWFPTGKGKNFRPLTNVDVLSLVGAGGGSPLRRKKRLNRLERPEREPSGREGKTRWEEPEAGEKRKPAYALFDQLRAKEAHGKRLVGAKKKKKNRATKKKKEKKKKKNPEPETKPTRLLLEHLCNAPRKL